MREFTEAEKQWLIANYDDMKQKDCAKHLHCSDSIVRRLEKELGIFVSRKTYDPNKKKTVKPVKVKKKVYVEDVHARSKGYCLDCCYYQSGGYCLKTKRETGALNKKICFKNTEG